jgi:hypothetical protein
MSLLESLDGTGGIRKDKKSKKGVPWEKGRKFKYMNKTKKLILGKYPKVFSNLRLSDVKSAPILIPRSLLMKKIEEIYNELTQRLLRSKKRSVLDISQVTRDETEKAMKSNPTYLIQSLINLIYSADKHGDNPETAQYLKFLLMPTGDYDLLYYLYIRQNFKIITHNSFLNNKVTGKDPTKMDMSYTEALEIADHAFYYNPKAREALRRIVKSKVKPKQRIRYYDFMVAIMEADVAKEELEILVRLLDLYRVKGNTEIVDEYTLTMDLRKAREEKNKAMGYTPVGGNGGGVGDGRDGNEFEDDMDFGDAEGGRRSVSGLFGDDDEDDEDYEEEGLKKGGNFLEGMGGSEDEGMDMDMDMDEDEDEEEEEETSFYLEDENLLNKYRSKIKLEDNELQKEIRQMSTRVIQEYITRFLDENKSAKAGPSKKQQIFDKLYKKIYNLNTVIFYTDRETYLDLLRVGKKNKQANELWEEMNRQYLYMCDLDDTDAELITEFLNTWLNNELVQSNTNFFLEYEYQVKNPIIEEALKVEAQVVITTKRRK